MLNILNADTDGFRSLSGIMSMFDVQSYSYKENNTLKKYEKRHVACACGECSTHYADRLDCTIAVYVYLQIAVYVPD